MKMGILRVTFEPLKILKFTIDIDIFNIAFRFTEENKIQQKRLSLDILFDDIPIYMFHFRQCFSLCLYFGTI